MQQEYRSAAADSNTKTTICYKNLAPPELKCKSTIMHSIRRSGAIFL